MLPWRQMFASVRVQAVLGARSRVHVVYENSYDTFVCFSAGGVLWLPPRRSCSSLFLTLRHDSSILYRLVGHYIPGSL